MKPVFALYIGRWQNWHPGHRWLIDQQLTKGKKVWIAIRDVEVDPKTNPKSANQIFQELFNELTDLIAEGRVFLSVIPDIESVNYGRGVGYEIIYHEPPSDIAAHSGTAIRAGMGSDKGYRKEE